MTLVINPTDTHTHTYTAKDETLLTYKPKAQAFPPLLFSFFSVRIPLISLAQYSIPQAPFRSLSIAGELDPLL